MRRTKKYTLEQVAALLPWPDDAANKYSRGKVTLVRVARTIRAPPAWRLRPRSAWVQGTPRLLARRSPCRQFPRKPVAGGARVGRAGGLRSLILTSAAPLWRRLLRPRRLPRRPAWPRHIILPGQRAPCTRSRARKRWALRARSTTGTFLVGSGFSADDALSAPLTCAVLDGAAAPVLVDGGALDALTSPEGRLLLRRRFVDGLPTVITPHAGEAARLAAPLELPTDDPAQLALLLSRSLRRHRHGGPATYISDGETVVRMSDGTPALAKAGTGDVLAGMAAALIAQKLAPVDACVLAATLHARAAQAAAKRLTSICVVAEDVVAAIPEAIASLS